MRAQFSAALELTKQRHVVARALCEMKPVDTVFESCGLCRIQPKDLSVHDVPIQELADFYRGMSIMLVYACLRMWIFTYVRVLKHVCVAACARNDFSLSCTCS